MSAQPAVAWHNYCVSQPTAAVAAQAGAAVHFGTACRYGTAISLTAIRCHSKLTMTTARKCHSRLPVQCQVNTTAQYLDNEIPSLFTIATA